MTFNDTYVDSYIHLHTHTYIYIYTFVVFFCMNNAATPIPRPHHETPPITLKHPKTIEREDKGETHTHKKKQTKPYHTPSKKGKHETPTRRPP